MSFLRAGNKAARAVQRTPDAFIPAALQSSEWIYQWKGTLTVQPRAHTAHYTGRTIQRFVSDFQKMFLPM